MNKKNILLISAGAAVVTLLVGYFVVVPAVQVGAYKETVAKKQSELNEAVNKLTAVLERDTFIKTDIEPSTIRSDVKVGNEAVKNAEAKLELVRKDLTSFNTLPLLEMNEKYKTAIALRANEQEYVTKIEAFVAEMKSVLSYMEKNADLTIKANDFAKTIAAANEAESGAEYSKKINEAVKSLQPVVDDLAKLTPPASLKEGHEYAVKSLGEYIALFKDSAAAVLADDLDKALDIDEKITAKAEEMVKKNDDYNAKFIRESELRKLDDALNQLDRDIDRKQATL